jgi:hypothetical protein
MKIFACILSLYILALTAIPCVDHPEDHTLQKIEITQSATGNHQHEGDQCSPFCTCDCCVSPIIHQDFIVRLDSFSFLLGCFTPEYASAFVSCYSGFIWQPPQLG